MKNNIKCPICKSIKVKSDKKKIFTKAIPLIFSDTEVTGGWGILFNTYLLIINIFVPAEDTKIFNCSDCGHTFIHRV
jgi:hypothetical protein